MRIAGGRRRPSRPALPSRDDLRRAARNYARAYHELRVELGPAGHHGQVEALSGALMGAEKALELLLDDVADALARGGVRWQ